MSSQTGIAFAAIIAAGGSGSRFAKGSQGVAKQFLHFRGLPLYAWSLLALSKYDQLQQIVVVTPSDMVPKTNDEIKDLVAAHNLRPKISVIAGGASRQASVFCGLKELEESGDPPDFVIVHDAARPFLDIQTVESVSKKVIECGACTVGGSVTDTIKKVKNGLIVETLVREELIAVQTPQAANFALLLSAHREAALAGFATTDDAALLEWAGHEVFVLEGPKYNLKVTDPLDLMLAEALADYL
ncbi:MAG: 2-C-methyl-D-erythritol 4-phosphate cytidylyltransferase [Candidatus Obscuribacterales bacterium]|nr:2-C-methyl-D-erythritol 4-phosphate cytidylyltransferase [Candidatus Obscuribacterales bacterium]